MLNKKSKLKVLLTPVLISVYLAGTANAAQRESVGEYVDSSSITAKIKANILADKSVAGMPISVNTYKNHVQLSGFVNTYAQKQKAVEIAENVKGVEEVNDVIVVK